VSLIGLAEGASWECLSEDKEVTRKTLRGHTSDVCDLAWSKDSAHLISGAVDGSTILWDISKLKAIQNFDDHGHYVQGVAWDPYQSYFCSQSADRTTQLYKLTPSESRYEAFTELSKQIYMESETDESSNVVSKKKSRKIYLDDSMPSFFRRPCWSPDGTLLFVPAGQLANKKGVVPTTYVYVRGKWSSPALHLPSSGKASVGVKCSPVLYKMVDNGKVPWADLPYRIVFAVITLDSVYIYDTQHTRPIAFAKHLHMAHLTDLSWSSDGNILMISSSDGYCSLCILQDLGVPLDLSLVPEIAKIVPTSLSNVGAPAISNSPVGLNTLVPRKRPTEVNETDMMESEPQFELHTLMPRKRPTEVSEPVRKESEPQVELHTLIPRKRPTETNVLTPTKKVFAPTSGAVDADLNLL